MAERERQRTQPARSKQPDGVVTVQGLPVDMLFEIFSYLHPLDLLHLSWVNTALRDLVMSKSYKGMWKAARKNVYEMPEPFPGMSEPEWAALAFVKKCSFCFEKTVMYMDLYLRCCAKTQQTDRASMLKQGHHNFDAKFRLLITNRASHVSSAFADDYALRSEYDAIDFTSDTAVVLKFAKRIYAHARLCEKWLSRFKVARAGDIHDIKQHRAQAICDKLSEIGYAEEIRIMPLVNMRSDFDEHPLVRKAQPMTDRIWTNIRNEMIVFAEKLREKRIIP
ncbi:hypothetical protein BDZ89DRAFT_1131351 [Hymenopellis radicata]|nr:hypothetical protein BDZ89DRAFT_1131351 [Hymenopellis radicata]